MRIKVKRLGINGEGVGVIDSGKLKDKVCFVSYALPNEEAEVTIISDKKKFAVGRLDKIYNRSENRVESKCPYYSKCGGCDLQHMDKFLQLEFKKNKVEETIHKISKFDINVDNTIRVNDYNYRNKMVYPVVTQNGKAKVGMFENQTHNIVDINKCLLCFDLINQVYSDVKKFIESSSFIGYDFSRKVGDIKYVVIRVYKEQVVVSIVSAKKIDLKELFHLLHSKYHSIGLSLVISNSNSEIMSGKYIQIGGIEALEIEEFGIKYSVDNRGFLQVNNEIKERLYKAVLDVIKEEDTVIDGYSGAGLMSAIIAKKCKKVIGIEINESASNSAKKLAIDNNLKNIKCINSDINNCIADVLEDISNCVVVLDPARSGCDSSVIDCLTTENNLKKISKIIYISCNPATLARDLENLKEYYQITRVVPYDMFPQTKHVETLVCMQRRV